MQEVKDLQEGNVDPNNIEQITQEINRLKNVAGQAIFEIGKWLKHVRDNIFTDTIRKQKGEWSDFLKKVDFDLTTAKRFIRIYEEFGEDSATWHELSMRVLYEIATLPEQERYQLHKIPSTGEVKGVEEMTVKELREIKGELKKKEKEKEEEEKREEAKNRIENKQAEEVEVEVEEPQRNYLGYKKDYPTISREEVEEKIYQEDRSQQDCEYQKLVTPEEEINHDIEQINQVTTNIILNCGKLEEINEDVKSDYFDKLITMVNTGLITIAQFSEDESQKENAALAAELIKEIRNIK